MIALTLALALQATSPDYEAGAEFFGQAVFIGSVCADAGTLTLDAAQLEETYNHFNRQAAQGGMTPEATEAAFVRGMAHEKARAGLLFTPGWEERRGQQDIALYLSQDCGQVVKALPNAFAWAQGQGSGQPQTQPQAQPQVQGQSQGQVQSRPRPAN